MKCERSDWMTSWVVADSGILLATVLPETYSAQAKALLFVKQQYMCWGKWGTRA